MSETTWDVIVVGGGAAGLSAALMLGRARRRVIVLDAGAPRNRFADHMHGVLGNDGASPLEFLARGRAEVEVYGVEVRTATVASVAERGAGVEVVTEAGERLYARRLIAATGVRDELPNIVGLSDRWGTDVLHCPYCHGWEVRDKRLAVIATSPMGSHQAQLIRQWSDDVVFFTDGAGVIDDALATALAARGVRLDDRAVRELIVENEKLTGVRLEGGAVIGVDAVFTAGVLRPYEHYLASLELKRDDGAFGNVIAVDSSGRTSNDRVWAAGNITVPFASVPLVMAAGTTAGAMVNMDLVTEDFAIAAAALAPAGLS